MKNIPEINIKLETKIVGQKPNQYNIEDMVQMFGDRLGNAVYVDENQKPVGLVMKKMAKMCRRWKFWNADIREAYTHYFGMLLAPYIISYSEPVVCYGADVDGAAISKMLTKEISSRYKATEIK